MANGDFENENHTADAELVAEVPLTEKIAYEEIGVEVFTVVDNDTLDDQFINVGFIESELNDEKVIEDFSVATEPEAHQPKEISFEAASDVDLGEEIDFGSIQVSSNEDVILSELPVIDIEESDVEKTEFASINEVVLENDVELEEIVAEAVPEYVVDDEDDALILEDAKELSESYLSAEESLDLESVDAEDTLFIEDAEFVEYVEPESEVIESEVTESLFEEKIESSDEAIAIDLPVAEVEEPFMLADDIAANDIDDAEESAFVVEPEANLFVEELLIDDVPAEVSADIDETSSATLKTKKSSKQNSIWKYKIPSMLKRLST